MVRNGEKIAKINNVIHSQQYSQSGFIPEDLETLKICLYISPFLPLSQDMTLSK